MGGVSGGGHSGEDFELDYHWLVFENQCLEAEEEASRITRDIHELVAMNVSDREMVRFYREATTAERPADPALVEELYREAGIYLGERVVKRLQDVQEFHARVVENRKAFLASEIARLEQAIVEREADIERFTERRSVTLLFLQEHGALEEFVALQERHNADRDLLASVRAQLDQLKRFEEHSAQLRIERDQLVLDARADFEERREYLVRAVELFSEVTGTLYEHPGTLVVDVNRDGGFSFDVTIERGRSQGVQEMMVFAYDLTVARLAAEHGKGPGFLIHDSTIFDGVDERQIARALELAHDWSNAYGFQYLCCLNSDTVPWDELRSDFELRQSVVLELSDAEDGGGLFGFRFD